MAIQLECDKGIICYTDTRVFGRWSMDLSSISSMGPEPLDTEAFHLEYLAETLPRKNARIKDVLLDQSFIAGLGNIYACEALHRAGLHPLKVAKTITRTELKKLCDAIRNTLNQALEIGLSANLDWKGKPQGDGFFYFGRQKTSDQTGEERFSVYDREGKPCIRCSTPVKRIKVSQRSTYYCPVCQKA